MSCRSAARFAKQRVFRWSEITYAYEMECLRKINIASVLPLLIHIKRVFDPNLTRGHIDILIRIPITEDNAAQQLCLAYQNISLRQSI